MIVNEGGGGKTLPDLTNPGSANDLAKGKQLIGQNGEIVSGAVPVRSASDVTASGATVTVPAGQYPSQVKKSVTTVTQASPSIGVNSNGVITATVTQSAGYTSGGTKTATRNLTVQGGKTVTPGTTQQTAVASGRYTTGNVYVAGDANLKAENIKKDVSIFGVRGTNAGEDIIQKVMSEGTQVRGDRSSGDSFGVLGYEKVHIVIRRHVQFQSADDDYWYISVIVNDDGNTKTYGILLTTTTNNLNTDWTDRPSWSAINIRYQRDKIYIDCSDEEGKIWSLDDLKSEAWYLLE